MQPINTLCVYITVGSEAEADRIAEALVNERLAACVNVLPGVRSIYRWQGSVEKSAEVLLLAKTAVERYPDLEARVRQLHSYETPCLVAWPHTHGYVGFTDWVRSECGC